MDVFKAIEKRKSVREYLDKPVEQEKLERILKAARLAPSAKNFQEWRFVVVKDKETIKQLVPAANDQEFIAQAPIIIACCAVNTDYVMKCGQLTYPIDVAIAIDHMTLAAVALGLGTCWIGSFFEDQVRKILNIPKDVRVVELLVLGYPDDHQPKKGRLPLNKIVMHEKWG